MYQISFQGSISNGLKKTDAVIVTTQERKREEKKERKKESLAIESMEFFTRTKGLKCVCTRGGSTRIT